MQQIFSLLTAVSLIALPTATWALSLDIFYFNQSNAFLSELSHHLNVQAEKKGIKLTEHDARQNFETQQSQIRQVLQHECPVLIVNIVDVYNGWATLELAQRLNIPVIFFNREPNPLLLQEAAAAYYVGSFGAQSGLMQAQIKGRGLTLPHMICMFSSLSFSSLCGIRL